MALCVPVRELKDTAKFLSVVEGSKGPVTVTRNGRDALVVMTPEAYDGLRNELAHERLMRRLDRANLPMSALCAVLIVQRPSLILARISMAMHF